MALASRGFAPLRALSGGIGAGRRRLTFLAPSSSEVHAASASAPPSPSFAAPTNPSDRRNRSLPSTLTIHNVTSFIGRSSVCGLVWSGPPANTSFGIAAHRLMSTSASAPEAARYFEGPWYEKYLLLEQYKKEHGNCLVPYAYAVGDVKLGVWVADQRQRYKKGELSANRREMLDALGFSLNPLADIWERNFALFEQYKEREGHIDVPRNHTEDGVKLGNWVDTQRKAYKRGKLDESYQRRLENLGMRWDPLGDQWERNFALLEQFQEREGHSNVPFDHEEEGVQLGYWVNTQRQVYKKGKLDESCQQRLENLGMSWDPLADQWEQNFSLLEHFKKREGHCDVSAKHEEDGAQLGM